MHKNKRNFNSHSFCVNLLRVVPSKSFASEFSVIFLLFKKVCCFPFSSSCSPSSFFLNSRKPVFSSFYATLWPWVLIPVTLPPWASSVQWGWNLCPASLPDTLRGQMEKMNVNRKAQQAQQVTGLLLIFMTTSQLRELWMPSQASLFLPIWGN